MGPSEVSIRSVCKVVIWRKVNGQILRQVLNLRPKTARHFMDLWNILQRAVMLPSFRGFKFSLGKIKCLYFLFCLLMFHLAIREMP